METEAGIKLTEKQTKQVKAFEKLMKSCDDNLCINCIDGTLYIMLLGDTKQNPIPEISSNGGFNSDNCIVSFPKINADGGGW